MTKSIGNSAIALAISEAKDYLETMEKTSSRKIHVVRTKAKGLGVRSGTRKVKFGNVVVTSVQPDRAAVAANVERSSEALARVAKKLIRPGFTARARNDVPRFSIDSANPKLIIRELNGRTERGKLVNGQFEVVD